MNHNRFTRSLKTFGSKIINKEEKITVDELLKMDSLSEQTEPS